MRYAHHRLLAWVGLTVGAALAAASPAAAETSQEQANKAVVLRFFDALDAGDAAGTTARDFPAIAEKFLDPGYTQHSEQLKNLPGTGTDRDKLIRMFKSMPPRSQGAGEPVIGPQKRLAIMAKRDLVMLLMQRDLVDPAGVIHPKFIFNMFRVQKGKLIEHWEVADGMGPPSGPSSGTPPGMPKP